MRWSAEAAAAARTDAFLAEVALALQSQAPRARRRRSRPIRPQDRAGGGSAQGRLREQHFTISAAGVTSFTRVDKWRTDAQFTPLVQWRREACQYHAVMSLPFFERYRRWRTYWLWRHELSSHKRRRVAKALDEQAFLLDRRFGAALLQVSALCEQLGNMRVHELTPSASGSTLHALADGQRRHLVAFAQRIDGVRDAILAVVAAACAAARTDLEEHLDANSAKDIFAEAEFVAAGQRAQPARAQQLGQGGRGGGRGRSERERSPWRRRRARDCGGERHCRPRRGGSRGRAVRVQRLELQAGGEQGADGTALVPAARAAATAVRALRALRAPRAGDAACGAPQAAPRLARRPALHVLESRAVRTGRREARRRGERSAPSGGGRAGLVLPRLEQLRARRSSRGAAASRRDA